MELIFDGNKYTGSLQGRASSSFGGHKYSHNISLLENHLYNFGISWDPPNYHSTQYYYRLYYGSTLEAFGTNQK